MCGRIAFDTRELDKKELAKIAEGSIKSPNEAWLAYFDKAPLLPIRHDNRTYIVEWGNRGDKESKMPHTGWARKESVDAGKWKWLHPEKIIIPCIKGQEKGVWFTIKEGIEGLLVRDEHDIPHAYMMTEKASHYYEMMTKHPRMPVLIGQVI